jgi:flagellar basal-body rod protein FlgB
VRGADKMEDICMKSLFEPHVNLVGKVMDMQLKRQNVVMSNLANVRTPGYKPRVLEFEQELQSALGLDARGKLSHTSSGHIPSTFDAETFGPEWDKKFIPREVHGEDRVDLDKEMALMAKTSLNYNALTTVIKSNFDGVRQMITEGSK